MKNGPLSRVNCSVYHTSFPLIFIWVVLYSRHVISHAAVGDPCVIWLHPLLKSFCNCQTDLDALRGCASGSVCVSGNNPLPRVVLSQGAGGQFGPGCSITRVADRLVVRFSSDPSHPSGSAEDQGGPTHSPAGCPTLASETLVFRSAPATAGSAMAIAEQGRPAGTSRWADMASEPCRPAPLDVASTEPVTERLDVSVLESLNNARAPSTRASYALRWRIFSGWCQSMDMEVLEADAFQPASASQA